MDHPDITTRQQEILDLILRTVADRGYPPTVREIGEAVGLSSPSTVHSHLSSLVRSGYLRRDPSKPRARDRAPRPAARKRPCSSHLGRLTERSSPGWPLVAGSDLTGEGAWYAQHPPVLASFRGDAPV